MLKQKTIFFVLIVIVVVIAVAIMINKNHPESVNKAITENFLVTPEQKSIEAETIKPQNTNQSRATDIKVLKTDQAKEKKHKAEQVFTDDLLDELPIMTEEQEAMLTVIMGDLGAAARVLYSMPSNETTTMLLNMFSNQNSPTDVRNRVIKVGMIVGAPSMKELFWKGLDDHDGNVRCSAIRAWLATGLHIDGLENKMKYLLDNDKSPKVRDVATQYFFERPEYVDVAVKELHKVLKEGNGRIVWKAAFALTSATVTVPGLKETTTELYGKYQNSSDSTQRGIASAAAAYLAKNGDLEYKEAILRFLADEDTNVRAGAILGMPAFKSDQHMITTLADCIRKETRTNGFYALSIVADKIKNPSLEQACFEVLDGMPNDNSHSLPRLNAALALSALGRKRNGLEIVYSQLHDLIRHNCVFRRVACARLRRASQMDLPCNIFTDTPEKEWETYIRSLEN